MKSNWIIPILLYLAGSLALVSAIIRLAGIETVLTTGTSSDADDLHYAGHLSLSLLHLIPGSLFLILGPLQFVGKIRQSWPAFHRWCGRIFILSGLLVGTSAILMNLTFPPVGGVFKSAAVFIFGIAQIVTLIIALRCILLKKIHQHKSWMIRAFAIGLSVSTMRAFFIPYFIIAGMPSEFVIGLAMWIGFVFNVLVAEIIVMRLNKQRKPIEMVAS